LQRRRTLLQVKKVSFEHIFIAVFGSSISSTLFISETNISLRFFSQIKSFWSSKRILKIWQASRLPLQSAIGVWSGTHHGHQG